MENIRKILIVLLLLIYGLTGRLFAQQSIYVKQTDGITNQIPLSQVQSITFTGTDMVLHKIDATTMVWAITDVQKYYYDIVSLVNETTKLDKNSVLVYPNPSNDNITIDYHVIENGKITISLISMDGRIIETLISDHKKKGKYTLNKSVNIEAGCYFINFQNANQLITKKIIFI